MKSQPLSRLTDHPAQPLQPPAALLAPEPVVPFAESNPPATTEALETLATITQISPGQFLVDLTVDQETHDLLLYVQALLGDEVPPNDLAKVLELALKVMIEELEQQVLAESNEPRT